MDNYSVHYNPHLYSPSNLLNIVLIKQFTSQNDYYIESCKENDVLFSLNENKIFQSISVSTNTLINNNSYESREKFKKKLFNNISVYKTLRNIFTHSYLNEVLFQIKFWFYDSFENQLIIFGYKVHYCSHIYDRVDTIIHILTFVLSFIKCIIRLNISIFA